MRNTLALVLIVLFAIRCVTPAASLPAAGTDLGQSLDALLTRYESYGFSGTVLVAKDGRIVLHQGYGLADRERGIRNDTRTLFEVASLAKTFTAASILLLEARGALRTDDPLSRLSPHLGPFPPAKAVATIDQLAAHTAGLVPEGTDLGDGEDREQFIASIKRVPLESPPGERYRYSNAGFSLLAAIVEKVSGVPYETFVRRNLFEPAGLRDIYFRGETIPPRLARGYVGSPAELKESVPPPYRWGTRGSGGVITTVGGLYRWHLALHEGRVLGNPELQKMFLERPGEGFAWHVERDPDGRRRIHKGGGNPEYASHVIYYPDEGLVIVWATNNLRQRWRQALNRGIAATAFGTPAVVPPAQVNGVVLDAYAGTYVAEASKHVQFAAKDGYLYALENDLAVPTDVMFFPTGMHELTGFNPTSLKLTRLSFDGDTVRVPTAAGEIVARKVKVVARTRAEHSSNEHVGHDYQS